MLVLTDYKGHTLVVWAGSATLAGRLGCAGVCVFDAACAAEGWAAAEDWPPLAAAARAPPFAYGPPARSSDTNWWTAVITT